MPLPPTAELICSFTTIKTEPLSPFVWLLLKTLNNFGDGDRPDFEILADKLAFKDARYLQQAWNEMIGLKLCENEKAREEPRSGDSDYKSARLTQAGKKALEDGFVRIGEPRRREGEALYFIIRDGSPVGNWKASYESKDRGPLDRPKWANKVTEACIAKALKEQRESGDEHIEPDEQIYDLEIHWEDSREVKLD